MPIPLPSRRVYRAIKLIIFEQLVDNPCFGSRVEQSEEPIIDRAILSRGQPCCVSVECRLFISFCGNNDDFLLTRNSVFGLNPIVIFEYCNVGDTVWIQIFEILEIQT